MRPSTRPSSKARRLKTALMMAGALVLVMVGLAAASQHAGAPSGELGSVSSSADDAAFVARDGWGSEGFSSSKGADSSSGDGAAANEDRSGTVVYRYVIQLESQDEHTVLETVRFGWDGCCETSEMEATFADESAAEAFLETLRRDYGPSFSGGSVLDSTVEATLDVSANKLDREAYEDALRDSVLDLSIVRKS